MKPLSQESRKRLKSCLLYVALPLACFELVSTIYFLGFVQQPLKVDPQLAQIIAVSVAYAVGIGLFVWVMWELILDRQAAASRAAALDSTSAQGVESETAPDTVSSKDSKIDSPLKTIAIIHLTQVLVWSLLVVLLTGTYELNFLVMLMFSPIFIGMSLLVTGCLWVIDKQRGKRNQRPDPKEESAD